MVLAPPPRELPTHTRLNAKFIGKGKVHRLIGPCAGVLRTPDGVVNVAPKAMQRPHKANGRLAKVARDGIPPLAAPNSFSLACVWLPPGSKKDFVLELRK